MILQWKVLAWAGTIILAAIAMNTSGMNDSTNIVIIPGITGAAWGIRGCLQ